VDTLFGAAIAEQRNRDVIERVITKSLQTKAIDVGENARHFMARECMHVVPNARVDERVRDARDGEVGGVGYEINFNRYFYKYLPPRPLEEIDAEMKELEAEIARLLKEVAG